MQILITAITVVVVTVQEGLLLAVKLAVAFATTQMLRSNLVRVLQSCETMVEVFLAEVYKPPADEQPDVE
jgi:MFS superfamily sulfate permease-like transporter